MDAVLLSHPDIAEAVAFGVPDDKYGEEVKLLKIKNLTYSFVLTNVFFYIINVNDPHARTSNVEVEPHTLLAQTYR